MEDLERNIPELAGGHRKNFESIRGGERIRKSTNSNEYKFYQAMRKNKQSDLFMVIPKTFDSLGLKENVIEMENIKFGLDNPKMMDIKIGTETMCKNELKRQGDNWLVRNIRKNYSIVKDYLSGSSTRGWRVTGGTRIKGNDISNGRNSMTYLRDFLGGKKISKEMTDKLYQKLLQIRTASKKGDYAFVDSSILIAANQKDVRATIIDFAFAFNKKQDTSLNNKTFNKYHSKFQQGLDSLISEVEKIKNSTNSKK